MRQRSCQTDLHVARVPRGTRAMPVNEKPCVSRRDSFFVYFYTKSYFVQKKCFFSENVENSTIYGIMGNVIKLKYNYEVSLNGKKQNFGYKSEVVQGLRNMRGVLP